MQITFKKKHILFACSPLRISNSLSDFHLVQQLKAAFNGYVTTQVIPPPPDAPEGTEPTIIPGQEDDDLTLTIRPQQFINIYKQVSAMPEGMTAAFSEQIMAYLLPQVQAGIQAGDPDWVLVANAIEDERQQHRLTFEAHTQANLNFLTTVDI